ncbi:hypothetical protein Goklo_012951 [Gossypium klotzschianum]|uniref:Uncharacterized protein n=1 Tax=Gossypium klotzschianum TaxID=34286 RepID=A0A7J8VDZ6_9ROSI|nr:hypothetical protein [Gossypium klotzschianum]
MKGTLMLSWILIICLSQVAVQSQYYSKSRPYHPRPPKVTNLHFFMHEHTGVTAVVLSKHIFKRRTWACGGWRKRTIHDGKRDCNI